MMMVTQPRITMMMRSLFCYSHNFVIVTMVAAFTQWHIVTTHDVFLVSWQVHDKLHIYTL